MKIPYFLITRFNCRVRWGPGNLGLNEDWLAHRFLLFEKFCVPSVLAQDIQEFSWLILVDERTPIHWIARLKKATATIESRVVLIPVSLPFEKVIIAAIKNITANRSEKFITTRFDNDDALARNFIATITNTCQGLIGESNYIINYASGCRLHKSGIYGFRPRYLNSFISVLSWFKTPITAMHKNHVKMNTVGNVVEIADSKSAPMWMQILHSRNAMNKLRREKKINDMFIRNFSIAEDWVSYL